MKKTLILAINLLVFSDGRMRLAIRPDKKKMKADPRAILQGMINM